MARRPTEVWRARVAEEAAGVAAGTFDPARAVAAKHWPDNMIGETDEVLDTFEAEVAGLVNDRREPAADTEVFEIIRRTVEALNAVDHRHGAYTDELDRLCAYIEGVLDEAGIDVDALAKRRGMSRYEITDEWRDW